MNFLRRLFKRSDDSSAAAAFLRGDDDQIPAVGGQRVTSSSACQLAAVYACRQAIAETLAMCPRGVFERVNERESRAAPEHSLHKILHDIPNQFTDAFAWFDAQQKNLLDYGNCYAQVIRQGAGGVVALIPLMPELMDIKINDAQRLEFIYQKDGRPQTLQQQDVLHISFNSRDGILGKSPFQIVAEAFGFGLALQRHALKLFENGAFFRGFIEAPHQFKDKESRDAFVKSVVEYLKRGSVGLLEQGVKFNAATMNNQDAQMNESRLFSVLDICRIYRIPPSFLAVTDGSKSYASVEQDAIAFVRYALQPWATRWEKAIDRQLLITNGDEKYFTKFNLDALLRGDLKSRVEAIIQQMQYGLKTINEARNLLDDNPIEDPAGDMVLVSHNLRPVSELGKKPEPAPVVETKPEEAPPEQDDTAAAAAAGKFGTEVKSGAEKENFLRVIDEFHGHAWLNPKFDKRQAFRPLFDDIFGRAVRREQKAVRSAAKKPGFLKWASDYYGEHCDYLREALQPALFAYGSGLNLSADDFVSHFRDVRSCQIWNENEAAILERSENWVEESSGWTEILFKFLEEAHGKAPETSL